AAALARVLPHAGPAAGASQHVGLGGFREASGARGTTHGLAGVPGAAVQPARVSVRGPERRPQAGGRAAIRPGFRPVAADRVNPIFTINFRREAYAQEVSRRR